MIFAVEQTFFARLLDETSWMRLVVSKTDMATVQSWMAKLIMIVCQGSDVVDRQETDSVEVLKSKMSSINHCPLKKNQWDILFLPHAVHGSNGTKDMFAQVWATDSGVGATSIVTCNFLACVQDDI